MEGDMDGPVAATLVLFYILGGLGIFFIGIGVLWFVTVYRNFKEKEFQDRQEQ